MSIVRKALLTTAIVGVGVGSMAGMASAHESNHAPRGGGDSCENAVAAQNSNGSGRSLGDTTGGAQDISASNVCDIFSDNDILNGANVATGGGIVRDGDDITSTDTRVSSSDRSFTSGSGTGTGTGGDLLDGGLLDGLLG